MFVVGCMLTLCGQPEQVQGGARDPPRCSLCPDTEAVSDPGLPLGFVQFTAIQREFHPYPPELCSFCLNFTWCHELNCFGTFRCMSTCLDGPWWLMSERSGAAACPANLCLVTLKQSGALCADMLVQHRTTIKFITLLKHLHLVG